MIDNISNFTSGPMRVVLEKVLMVSVIEIFSIHCLPSMNKRIFLFELIPLCMTCIKVVMVSVIKLD